MSDHQRRTGGTLWARHVFRVSDVARSIAYYCDALGFTKDWVEEGRDPAIGQVSRNGVTLMLDARTYFPKAGAPGVVTLTLNDVPQRPALHALHEELVAASAKVTRAPFRVPWDAHVFEIDIEDPDGNVLMFWGHMPADG
ncbi:MAG TPA: glyoxalase superfamily protein [Vicinamibacterales bacterium]|nr:glyoxalase superfamily protein [Vicinamibacterales bacterium]